MLLVRIHQVVALHALLPNAQVRTVLVGTWLQLHGRGFICVVDKRAVVGSRAPLSTREESTDLALMFELARVSLVTATARIEEPAQVFWLYIVPNRRFYFTIFVVRIRVINIYYIQDVH